MASVAVNPPKTPVTKGSNGMATATLPNVCKMPGPPPPFVPTPLPNIGMSGKDPKDYSTTVTFEGEPVGIQGASFGSSGDIASKGTGGGLVSNNAEGPTKFVGPGSMDVQVEGKRVQFLGDQTLNNCGPSGSPANSATMQGIVQPSAMLTATLGNDAQKVCDAVCANYTPNKANPTAPKPARPSKGTQAQLDANGVGRGELTQWLPSSGKGAGSFTQVTTKAGNWAQSSTGCGSGTTVRWDRSINGKWVELKGDNERFTTNQQRAINQGKGTPPGSSGNPIVVRPRDCGCDQI